MDVAQGDDTFQNYDTDAVSLTSTQPSDVEDPFYEVEDVVAEGVRDDVTLYLVKWRGYGWHRCTWEPREHLEEGDATVYESWEQRKSLFSDEGPDSLQAWMAQNQDRYENAVEAANANKALRQEKRRKKRLKQLQSRRRRVIRDSESDDDFVPTRITDAASDDDEPLIKRFPKASGKASPLFEKEKQSARKPPLAQSDSSSSEGDEDEFMAGLRKKAERRKKAKEQSQSSSRRPSVDNKAAASKNTQKPSTDKAALQPEKKREILSKARDGLTPVSRANSISSGSSERTKETTRKKASTLRKPPERTAAASSASASSISGRPASGPSLRGRTVATPRAGPSEPRAGFMRRSAPNATSGPIRLTNKPPGPPRKEWQSDKLFNTLKFRYNAEKRSHREGVPDISDLDFVNADPGVMPRPAGPVQRPAATRPDDNPYGRREYGRVREQERDATPPREQASADSSKVPLTCFEWVNGSCQKGERCAFLHRVTEPLKYSPLDGSVPPKYRRQPLTCYPYWKSAWGCNNSADDCLFAHKNTGWLANFEGKPPSAIAQDEVPVFQLRQTVPREPRQTQFKENQKFPKALITCRNFMLSELGCTKGDRCDFAHHNTGRLGKFTGGVEEIPREMLPVSEREREHLKGRQSTQGALNVPVANVPAPDVPVPNAPTASASMIWAPPGRNPADLTCSYWYDGHCNKTDEQCKFQHHWTGQLAGRPGRKTNRTLESWEDTGRDDAPPQDPIEADTGHNSLTATKRISLRNSNRLESDDGIPVPTEELALETRRDSVEEQRRNLPLSRTGTNRSPVRRPSYAAQSPAASQVPPALEATSEHRLQGAATQQTVLPPMTSVTTIPPQLQPPRIPTPSTDAMPSPSLSITIPPPPTSRPPSTIPPPPPPETPQSAETKTSAPLTCTKLKSTIESAFNLGFHTLFRTNEDAAILLDRRAFLFFHSEDHLEEIELITRWLLMHHVEVYVPAIEGSWDHFCAQTLTSGVSGIILAHPDFERFWNVPKFGEVLRRNVRVWCVGYQDAFGYDEQISTDLEEKNVDCIEIFPHGGIIYITEDVFEKTPQEALRIIQLFLEKVERCRAVTGPAYDPWRSPALQNGCLLWRLAVRPEFMEWTYQWCEEHEKELEAGDPDAQARAKIYELLSNPEYIEQDNQQNNPERWKPRPDDYYPIISERREVMQEYFYALECGDKEEPMRGQVELFAGTVNALRRDYRHFCVVHTEPGEVDWRKRWQNIDEVMTPAQCISYFEQPAKGNRFESYEWCFPLKEGEEVGKGELEEEEERGRRKTRDGGEVKRDLGTVKEVGDGVMEDVEEEELVSPTVSMDTSSSS